MKKFEQFFSENEPYILSILSTLGLLSSLALGINATVKATHTIDKLKEEAKKERKQVTRRDQIKATWKYYIPMLVTSLGGIGCSVLSIVKTKKTIGTIATAYNVSQAAFTEYRKNVVEKIGETEEKNLRLAAEEKSKKKQEVVNREVIFAGSGDILCIDAICGGRFRSNATELEQNVNILNKRMISEGYISLNEYYYQIGIPSTNLGQQLGWNLDRDGLIELDFSSKLENNIPCLVVSFKNQPQMRFDVFA